MRSLAVLLALLVFSCSSATDVIDSRVLGCESGGDIMLRAGLSRIGSGNELIDDNLTLLIEVSNNTHHEIVVEQIRIDQAQGGSTQTYRIDPVYQRADKTIAEDDDFTFELPMTGRGPRDPLGKADYDAALDLVMSLYLGNGDLYRCGLRVPAPR